MYPRSRSGYGGIALLIGIIVFFVLLIGLYSVYGTQRTVTFTVDHRERTGGDEGKYLVFTEDDGVFQDTDSIFYFKYDSSDVYGQLDEGGTYECDVYGWRVPLFSWYPNIKSCEVVKEPQDG